MPSLLTLLALAAGLDAGTASWPAPAAELHVQRPELARKHGGGRWRLYLDAGHGAAGNEGVASVTCQREMDFTLDVAEDLARRLEATGRFEVKLSRRAGEAVSYPARLRAAAAFGADAIVSLHADARGMAHAWEASPGTVCWRNDETPGFAVLYSDRGERPLAGARARLGRALARRLSATGFLAYDGRDYLGLYLADASQPGAFIDRRHLYFLRKPEIPSVIVETHHFLDLEETARWHEPRTLDAFAAAVASALAEALDGPGPAGLSTHPPLLSTSDARREDRLQTSP